MISTPAAKKTIIVYPHDIDFFKTNFPIHHRVLMDLIERGEAVLQDTPEAA